MTVNNHHAKIEYDEELDMFRGEILGLNGGADFYGRTPDELREEFQKSLDVFFDVRQEEGIEPYPTYSGQFDVLIPTQLHKRLAVMAEAEGKSLNTLAQEALQNLVRSASDTLGIGQLHSPATDIAMAES
ncbi:MAG: type II toxin-antitoxin system HicB family antitoxin [Chloroflexota bacterium]